MRKYFLIFFCVLFSFSGISQTECEYNVSFFLRTKKGRLVKKIYRKDIDEKSYISRYFTKENKHYFSLVRLNYCSYELILKKGNKKLKLVFHNTKERTSFASLGTLPMIDTTIHFYDGLRYKPIPIDIKDEMPKMVTIPKKELPIEIDTTNCTIMSKYGGFKNVKAELISNRIGIDNNNDQTKNRIAHSFGIYPKVNFDIYELSQEKNLEFTAHNQKHINKLGLGKVYRLSFTELTPIRNMDVAFFDAFQVVKETYVTKETLENFAKLNNFKVKNTKGMGVDGYTISCPSNDLQKNYKIISESGLFKLITPSFFNNSKNIHRNKGQIPKPINPFSDNGKPSIDSVQFYSVIMNDGPMNFIDNSIRVVVTKNAMFSVYVNQNREVDINQNFRIKLSDSLFKEAQFMLTQLPAHYLDSVGNFGDCLVPLNQSSNYNCFTMLIFKSDGSQLILQGNELPRDLHSYYFKAYQFNDRLRK